MLPYIDVCCTESVCELMRFECCPIMEEDSSVKRFVRSLFSKESECFQRKGSRRNSRNALPPPLFARRGARTRSAADEIARARKVILVGTEGLQTTGTTTDDDGRSNTVFHDTLHLTQNIWQFASGVKFLAVKECGPEPYQGPRKKQCC
jgi:hypothetical protein